jgi:glycosyltransferase involved in cell wall biosynthesis
MRALIASHSAGLRGGAERCVLELARELRCDGRVEPIVAMPMRGELTKALEACNVRTHIIPSTTWLVDPSPPWPHDPLRAARRVKRIARVARAVPAWTRLLREVAPDVVMSSTTFSPTAALAARRVQRPHVWWIHEFTTVGLDKRYALGETMSQRWIGHLSKIVAVNSRAAAAYYAPPISKAKIRLIELGVEPAAVSANEATQGSLRVLMLGRKAPAKGCEVAIRALAAAANSGYDIRMRMVGPAVAGYAVELWYLARDLDVLDRVEFIEYEPDPTTHLDWCNVVLVAAVGEAFGRVTVEALKSGRPVVAARSGATTEVLADGFSGFLVEPSDVDAFAAVLQKFAADAGVVEQMALQSVSSIAGRFTLRGEVDTFVELFSELRPQ